MHLLGVQPGARRLPRQRGRVDARRAQLGRAPGQNHRQGAPSPRSASVPMIRVGQVGCCAPADREEGHAVQGGVAAHDSSRVSRPVALDVFSRVDFLQEMSFLPITS